MWGDPPHGMSERVDAAVRQLGRQRAKAIRESRPEWVMLGLDWPGPGVLLMASRSLTQAQLDFRAREYRFDSWEEFLTPGAFRPELTLSVHMANDYVVVAGPDYVSCLAALLEQWSPDGDGPAVPAIEGRAGGG